MSSTQIGKTELILNAIAYHVDQDPCPMLLVEPDLNIAEAVSKDRIAPMVRDTPALRGKIKDARARDSGNTLLQKVFPGGHLTLAGSNSAASLANRPIRKLLLDEVDRYAHSAGTEGDPSSLAEKRTTTFEDAAQIIRVSSPSKTVGSSSITACYKRSDQREYFLPCPICGHFQLLKFGAFKYVTEKDDEGKEKIISDSVRLQCGGCKLEIEESDKQEMLTRGKWVARRPYKGIAGFWISEFYSPWKKWAQVFQDYLDKKDDPQTLKTFLNTSLSELVDEKGEAPSWEKLYSRREPYRIGVVPYGPAFLTGGCDVQRDRIEVEIVAWGRGKESWSIDYQIFHGDTSTVESEPWRKLAELLNTEYQHEGGGFLPIRMLAVDSNYNTQTVYSWVRQWPRGRVIAIRGQEALPTITAPARTIDLKKSGKVIRRGMRYWPVGTSVAKDELYGWLRLDPPDDPTDLKPCFCHFPEYPQDYFKQLTAESSKIHMVRGSPKYVWTKDYERNEALDCRIYARAAAYAYGLDRFSDRKWAELELDLPKKPRGEIKTKPHAPDQSAPVTPPRVAQPNKQAPPKPMLIRRKSSFL